MWKGTAFCPGGSLRRSGRWTSITKQPPGSRCAAALAKQATCEAILLSLIGGAVGVGLGVLSTAVYASTKGWTVVVPTVAWTGGLGSAVLIGAVAGLLPALRAARMSPTEALWTV